VFFSIKWFRTQHPQPVLWGGGSMDPSYRTMLFGNWAPILILAMVFIVVRMRQARAQREIDAMRRTVHAF
jgi:heme exporter protein C